MNDRDSFWHAYFSGLHGRDEMEMARRVGMSNDRVTAQEYAIVLEASGALPGRRALDVGCGLGPLARALHALGATVHGIDYVQGTIGALQKSDPHIEWTCEDVSNPSPELLARRYDLICACEILQHVEPARVLQMLWRLLAPGGRLVGLVPNADCPIVQRVESAYPTSYFGLTAAGLHAIGQTLPDLAGSFLRGATFQPNQAITPYAVSAWFRPDAVQPPSPPNRLQVVFLRKASVENRTGP